MSSSEDETARILRQQAEDLGDHRITALPLGDRQPGRRGQFQASRFNGPGDARFNLGSRPGDPVVSVSRPRAVEVESRWLDLFDDSLVPERKDGLGGGELHRSGMNFRPRRRNSFSEGSSNSTTRDALIAQTRYMAIRNPVGPSSFRGGRGGSVRPNFALGERPRDRRFVGSGGHGGYGSQGDEGNHIGTAAPRGQARGSAPPPRGPSHPTRGQPPPPRAPRPGVPRPERTGNWGAAGLVHDQGAFFDNMIKHTGLRCPPMVKVQRDQQAASKEPRVLAKPMASAKDLPLEAKEVQVERPDKPAEPTTQPVRQTVENVRPSIQPTAAEPIDQPAEPPKQSMEPPKTKPPNSGFIPPHLRHTLKKQDPTEVKIEEKSADLATQENAAQAFNTVQPQEIANSFEKESLFPAEEATPSTHRAPKSPTLRSFSSGTPPLQDQKPSPIQEEAHSPVPSIPRRAGNAPVKFTNRFWELVAKPMWGDLLADYQDVHQQVIFLSCYYAERPEEWQKIIESGPPTRETLIRITQQQIEEDHKEEIALRQVEEKKMENALSPKLGSAPQPPDTWWKIDVPDAAISDWAGKLQESHRAALVQSLKDRISVEKDPRQTQILYAKISMLLHGSNEDLSGAQEPDTKNTASSGAPKKLRKEHMRMSKEADDDVSILCLDALEAKEPKKGKKELSPLSQLMVDLQLDIDLNDDSMTEDVPPLTKEHEKTTRQNRFDRASPPAPAPRVPVGGVSTSRSLASVPSSTSRTPTQVIRGVSTPRETSDERREREKKERMEQINREFARKKQGRPRGTDGHQETPPKLKDATCLADLDQDAMYETISTNVTGDMEKAVSEDIESEHEESQIQEENSFIDFDDYSADGFPSIEDLVQTQSQISSEELRKIQEINRDSIAGLTITCPWWLSVRLADNNKPGYCFAARIPCTAKMPSDFLKQLREKFGNEDWEELSSTTAFRTMVAEVTKQFHYKMARKWGAQFLHGIAK